MAVTYTSLAPIFRGDTWYGIEVTVKLSSDQSIVDLTNVDDIWVEFRVQNPAGPLQHRRTMKEGHIVIPTPTDGKFTVNPFVYTGVAGLVYLDNELRWNNGQITTVAPAMFQAEQDVAQEPTS